MCRNDSLATFARQRCCNGNSRVRKWGGEESGGGDAALLAKSDNKPAQTLAFKQHAHPISLVSDIANPRHAAESTEGAAELQCSVSCSLKAYQLTLHLVSTKDITGIKILTI